MRHRCASTNSQHYLLKQLQRQLSTRIRMARRIARAELESLRNGVFWKLRYLQTAWCNPADISLATKYFVPKVGGYLICGSELERAHMFPSRHRFITPGDWDIHTTPITNVKHIARTTARYSNAYNNSAEAWEDVGEINWMTANIDAYGVQDNCRSREEVLARCARLDALKMRVEQSGRMLSQQALTRHNFREAGGIGIAISRTGQLIWFNDGAHRLAIAKVLKLREIPICIERVHSQAVEHGNWSRNIRSQPTQ